MCTFRLLVVLSISSLFFSERAHAQDFYIPHGLHLLPLLFPDGDPSDAPLTGAAKEANYALLNQQPVAEIRKIAQREFLDVASEDSPEMADIAKATIIDTKAMDEIKANLQSEGFDVNNIADVATMLVLSSYNLSKNNTVGNGLLTEKEIAAARKSMTEFFVSSVPPGTTPMEIRFFMDQMLLERVFQDKIISYLSESKYAKLVSASEISGYLTDRADSLTGFPADSIRINAVQGIVVR